MPYPTANMNPQAGDPSPLPPWPTWQTRSFWLSLIMGVSLVLEAIGVNFAEALGFSDNNALVDNIMIIIGGIAGLLAWQQRLNPHFKLVWHNVTKRRQDPILRSPAFLGLGLVAALLLAGCGVEGDRPIIDRPPTCEEARMALLIVEQLGQDTTKAAGVLSTVCPPVVEVPPVADTPAA